MNFKNSEIAWLIVAFLLGYFAHQICSANVVEGQGIFGTHGEGEAMARRYSLCADKDDKDTCVKMARRYSLCAAKDDKDTCVKAIPLETARYIDNGEAISPCGWSNLDKKCQTFDVSLCSNFDDARCVKVSEGFCKLNTDNKCVRDREQPFW